MAVIGQFLRAEATLIADAARELSSALSNLKLKKDDGGDEATEQTKQKQSKDEL